MENQEIKQKESASPNFSKAKILTFNRYAKNVDALNALLEDDKKYTLSEVDKLISKFMKGRVK